MARVTHTHRGHCQFCLRVHAIDTVTGRLAKHGYEVEHGMFNGQCPGSDELSLHVERSRADYVIKLALADEERNIKLMGALARGEANPETCWNGRYEVRQESDRYGNKYMNRSAHKMVPFAEAPELYQQEAIRCLINQAENNAVYAKRHADQMTEWAAKIYDGKVPAYPNKEFDNGEWQVGDTIRVGGKKGYDAVIEAIEDREYRTNGWNRGSQKNIVPHARFTRPAVEEKRSKDGWTTIREGRVAKTLWEPLRNIKRESSKLVQELKKAGLV